MSDFTSTAAAYFARLEAIGAEYVEAINDPYDLIPLTAEEVAEYCPPVELSAPVMSGDDWSHGYAERAATLHGETIGRITYRPAPLVWSGADGEAPRPYEVLAGAGRAEVDSLEEARAAALMMWARWMS